MQEHLKQEPKSLQKALEQKEQLEARIANERSKYAADLRTAQSRHKHMIGGAVVKYFPGVYHFDEAEVNEIIMAALATREGLKTIKTISYGIDSFADLQKFYEDALLTYERKGGELDSVEERPEL